MTDRPIIFSAAMVRALLDGRKTMTRRLAWSKVRWAGTSAARSLFASKKYRDEGNNFFSPPSIWQQAQPGDRLWVRESHYVWCAGNRDGTERCIDYRATNPDAPCTWTPSIHMPRWASRLTLVVTGTKIEPLQSITSDDAKAEGIDGQCQMTGVWVPQIRFAELWTSLHGAESWRANPDVVALSFTVHRGNIDAEGGT